MPAKVLVIDPNAAEGSLLNTTLQGEGYEVLVANSLNDGLSALELGGVDLLLLSAEADPDALPSWWEIVGPLCQAIPVIAIGDGATATVPAQAVLDTPVNTDELVMQVRIQLAESGAAPADAPAAQGGITGLEDTGKAETPADVMANLQHLFEERAKAAAEVPGAAGAPSAEESLEGARFGDMGMEEMRGIVGRIAREVAEKVVWETVPSMVAQVISEKQAEQDKLFKQIVEKVVWETIPEIAEAQVKAEIRRIAGDK